MGRTILAVIAGAAAMWLATAGLEFLGHVLFPPPAGLDPRERSDLARIVAASSAGALTMLVLAWTGGALAGGAVAAAISRGHRRGAALAVALLVMAGVAGMVWLVPGTPAWVWIAGLLLPVPAALCGARIARGPRPPRGAGRAVP